MMMSSQKTMSMKTPKALLVFIASVLSFAFLIPSCWAINCYVCKSEDNSACTATKPSGKAKPAADCSSPNELFRNWVNSHDFMKAGFGDISIEKLFNAANDETNKGAELKNVTGCAYMYVSSENKVTKEVDKAVAQTRSFFGDKNADESVTIQRWIMRDCVRVELKEGANEEANRCVPVPGVSDIAKVQFCTCTTDECNLPNEKVQAFIKDAESGADGRTSAKGLGALSLGLMVLTLGILMK